jgi:hypothetical protein
MEKRSVTRIVYLLAASHSGSTLLAMLLGRHPELCTVGELKATSLGDVSRYRCSCGALIEECAFWRQVSQEMARKGYAYKVTEAGTHIRSGMSPYARRLLTPLHRGPLFEMARDCALALSPTWRRRYPEIQGRNAALAATILELTGRKALVDSSKIGLRLKYLLRTPGIDVKVVRLVRDGRGVALTYTDPARFADAVNPELKGGGSGGDRAHQRLTIAQAAREWRRSTEEAEHLMRKLGPDRVIEIRYEDLCRRPQETLRPVLEFVGVDPDALSLDFRSTEHHIVGNGMRLDTTTTIEMDERWRTALTPQDLTVFDEVAGGLRRRLGYL